MRVLSRRFPGKSEGNCAKSMYSISRPKFERHTYLEYKAGTSPLESACSEIRDGVGRYGGAEPSDSVQ
jgi:hypothetical protein